MVIRLSIESQLVIRLIINFIDRLNNLQYTIILILPQRLFFQ